ncbi:hypothetical protein MMC31_002825, partial [Peltigera leucophlebia]|nr:hypothetical protein [Peltigera leucophlebia]
SKSFIQERADSLEQSQTTSERNYGNQNKKAKEENVEAPGIVLRMDDEEEDELFWFDAGVLE